MTGFNAGTVVQPLEYSFKPYASAEGTIKEPTDEQIGQFLEDIKAFYSEVAKEASDLENLGDTTSPDEVLAQLNSMDLAGLIGKMEMMSAAYSKLCSGKPTTKQIQDLPLRVRAHFFAWLQGEVVSPEAGPGAGNAQVVSLRTERAG